MPIAVIILVAFALFTLAVIVVAPWRRVRAEGPLPHDVEAQVLLGEPPDVAESRVEHEHHVEPPPAAS